MKYIVYSLAQQINWSTTFASVGQFFNILLMLLLVSLMAYFTVRLLGSAKFARGGKRNLEIIESMGVGMQSFVHIIRVGSRYMVIGVARGRVEMIAEIDENNLQLSKGGVEGSFQSLVNNFMNRKKEDKRED